MSKETSLDSKNLILLSSFPRLGNTWLRLLSTDFSCKSKIKSQYNTQLSNIQNYVPETHCDYLHVRWVTLSTPYDYFTKISVKNTSSQNVFIPNL